MRLPILAFFNHSHLPPDLQDIARPFHRHAHELVMRYEAALKDGQSPACGELATALRRLLEAKDCAVRAFLPSAEPEPLPEPSADVAS